MDVLLWAGTGEIGTAIVRRVGAGMKIIAADINPEKAENAAEALNSAGFDVLPLKADISSGEEVRWLIGEAQRFGEITALINTVGAPPSKTPIERIISSELCGTAVLLEEVGSVIAVGGAGLVVSSAAGHRLDPLGVEADEQLAVCPAEELSRLGMLSREKIRDRLHAHMLAHYGVQKRAAAQAVRWGERGARLNCLSVGLTASSAARQELCGGRSEEYRNMYMKAPAGRLCTADEIAGAAEFLMGKSAAFITGAELLIDGGATAEYRFGALRPQ